MNMDCPRSQELLSDHLEGSLHAILHAELDAHLATCGECRSLREAVAEVVDALRAYPVLEPPAGLAERVVAATRALPGPRPSAKPVMVRPAIVLPAWVQAAAAGLALIALGVLLMVVGPVASGRRRASSGSFPGCSGGLIGSRIKPGNGALVSRFGGPGKSRSSPRSPRSP